MQMRRRGGLASLFAVLVLCVAMVYGAASVTNPWAFHIGGRWTPLLYWSGYGTLATKNGTYPLYISFFPSAHFSRLHLDSLRPTGGVQGSGWLCSSPGVTQHLKLSGTIYGGWSSTVGSVMDFRLLEPKIFDVGQRRGFFNLYGRWQGPQLIMDDRGEPGSAFRSGLKIEHASVTFAWGPYSDFKVKCATATINATHR
ncbi:MAG TPA: hypothetical protein VEI26_05745 [Terriglobales bacterium]|nr:hypothetical protein [Terriglobales bacterium]